MSPERILIIGASSDIGLALIRRLHASPAPPLIVAHCHSGGHRLEELRESLRSDSIHILQADCSSHDEVVQLGAAVETGFGIPTGFVHLPGMKLVYERFRKVNWSHLETDLVIQVRSAITLLQRFLPGMAKLPDAAVVFVLSSVTR